MRLVYGAYECASARRAHTHRLGGACLVHFMTLSVTRDVDVEQQIVGLHSLLSVEWGLFYLIGDSVRSRSLSWTRNRGMAGGERQNRATANRQLSRIGDSALVSTSRAARIEFLWRIIRDAHNLLVLFAFPTSDCNALAYACSTFECSPAVASTSQMFKIDYFFFSKLSWSFWTRIVLSARHSNMLARTEYNYMLWELFISTLKNVLTARRYAKLPRECARRKMKIARLLIESNIAFTLGFLPGFSWVLVLDELNLRFVYFIFQNGHCVTIMSIGCGLIGLARAN